MTSRSSALIASWVFACVLASAPSVAQTVVGPATRQDSDAKQQDHPPEPDWFLEPTYVGWVGGDSRPGGLKNHFIEIQSFHHVPMFPRQNSGRYHYWATTPDGELRSRKRFALTLGTTIRGHLGPSVPIQTPSIFFAGRGQYLRHYRRGTRSTVALVEGGLNHHSNGQDGCTFVEQQRRTGACEPKLKPAPRDWTLNTVDGSFGVNYFSLKSAVSVRRIAGADAGAAAREVERAQSVQLEFRRYVTFVPGGGGIEQIAPRFGRNEIDAMWQVERPSWLRPGQFRHAQLTVRGWRRFGRDSRSSGGAAAELAWLGFAGGVAGPFVRAYRGSDYYNIRFEENRRFVLLGLKWDKARLSRLPRE